MTGSSSANQHFVSPCYQYLDHMPSMSPSFRRGAHAWSLSASNGIRQHEPSPCQTTTFTKHSNASQPCSHVKSPPKTLLLSSSDHYDAFARAFHQRVRSSSKSSRCGVAPVRTDRFGYPAELQAIFAGFRTRSAMVTCEICRWNCLVACPNPQRTSIWTRPTRGNTLADLGLRAWGGGKLLLWSNLTREWSEQVIPPQFRTRYKP